jgi:predicted dithiol-disulfide oxidoreductase (DUF899 family)
MTMPVMEPDLDAATLEAWARAIDDGPFSSLCWGERIAFDNPDAITLLGALAAWTERVRLVTTVLVPQLHDSVMLAKALATADVLSGGRLTVGLGVGGRLEDYRAENGPASLLDLFDGRRQLIVQHFMFGPDWNEGCSGCSMMADHIGPLSHLHAKDTSLVLVSRAPLGKLLEFRDRMGWTLPWVSSESTTFNQDFRATVDGEEHHAISVFLRDRDRVFHTWSTYNRGEEPFMVVFDLLDLTPFGRQETWEDSPEGWPQQPPYEWMRLHDAY